MPGNYGDSDNSAAAAAAALVYQEPSIVTILEQASFLLLLHSLHWALDRLIYCGLVGQILVGTAWGTPGAQLLSNSAQEAVVQLGYLGLILVVFEGGLSTSCAALRANVATAVVVALTGISVPVALSFVLLPLASASPLQCFAAGAALCSTSLGTTLTVLRASGLNGTRLGVVITTAAMLDDVVGLAMVQVIANLGREAGSDQSVSVSTVLRPILVALALVIVAVTLCWCAVRPVSTWLFCQSGTHIRLNVLLHRRETALILQSGLLIGLITTASYAGTSNLFAAYIAGSIVSWWKTEVGIGVHYGHSDVDNSADNNLNSRNNNDSDGATEEGSGPDDTVYKHYYHPAVSSVLLPFFFASIGFAIPITRMFAGATVWRGIVYAALMILGKLICGLWLVRLPGYHIWLRAWLRSFFRSCRRSPAQHRHATVQQTGPKAEAPANSTTVTVTATATLHPPKPRSLYPAVILGLAMVPRGEIGFLVSGIAQSNGLFGGSNSSPDIFLIAIWAIVLCTVAGPLCVGLLVRRVRRLQTEAESAAVSAAALSATPTTAESCRRSSTAILGVWGVQP